MFTKVFAGNTNACECRKVGFYCHVLCTTNKVNEVDTDETLEKSRNMSKTIS